MVMTAGSPTVETGSREESWRRVVELMFEWNPEAIREFDRLSVQRADSDPIFHLNRGDVLTYLGQFEEASKSYQAALSLDATNSIAVGSKRVITGMIGYWRLFNSTLYPGRLPPSRVLRQFKSADRDTNTSSAFIGELSSDGGRALILEAASTSVIRRMATEIRGPADAKRDEAQLVALESGTRAMMQHSFGPFLSANSFRLLTGTPPGPLGYMSELEVAPFSVFVGMIPQPLIDYAGKVAASIVRVVRSTNEDGLGPEIQMEIVRQVTHGLGELISHIPIHHL